MIRSKIFYGESTPALLKGANKVVGEMIHSAHQRAEAWLAENPQVEVVSISNGYGNTVSGIRGDFCLGLVSRAFLTGWHRRRQAGNDW